MNFNPADFVTNHPYQAMIYAFLFTNAIATMPTPNGTGFRGSTFYKWLFGFLHSLPNIPRLLIALFPQLAATFKLITPDQAEQKKEDLQPINKGATP